MRIDSATPENVPQWRAEGMGETRAAEALNPAVVFSTPEFMKPLLHVRKLINRIGSIVMMKFGDPINPKP